MNRCLLLPCALQAEQPARSPSKCPTSAPEAKNASRENDCAVLVVVGVMAAFGQVRTFDLYANCGRFSQQRRHLPYLYPATLLGILEQS
jgi:hypothetical protein